VEGRLLDANVRPRTISTAGVVLFLISLMYGITYIDRVNVSAAASFLQKDLHLTNTQFGLVFSAFAYPYLIFTVFGGWLSDRFGARKALTLSAVIWGTATLLTGLVSTLAAILFARVMLGLGEGATFPIATRAMSDWMPAGRRGFAQGITHSSSRLGAALTPPLVAGLIAATSWRGAFIVLGIISLGWAFVWGHYFRDDPSTHRKVTAQELESLPTYSQRNEGKGSQVPWLPLILRMLPVTGVYFCYGWTLWLYLAWIPSFFLRSYGLDLKTSALFSAGVFLAGVVGDTLGGTISDRILLKTGDRNKARRDLVVAGFLCSLAAMGPILFMRSAIPAAICLSLAFFFSEFTIGPMWTIPMDIAPEYSGSASGLMNIGSPLAAVVSPLIFGYVIDKTGNWSLPFLGSMGLLFLGSILAFWMKPGERFVQDTLGSSPAARIEPKIHNHRLP
jgi:MFS family permease